jgi:hypothetical protein
MDLAFRELALDASMIDRTIRDNIVRSVDVLVVPFAILACLGLAAMMGYAATMRALAGATPDPLRSRFR